MAGLCWNLLLVDDDEDDYVIIHSMLNEFKNRECRLYWASSYQDGLDMLGSRSWEAILVDFDLGATNGLDFLRQAREMGSGAAFIMVTGRGRYELDVQAMQAGFDDYLTKDMLNSAFLERVIRYAIEHRQAEARLHQLVDERTSELETALEELQVVEEELRIQNEQLAGSIQEATFQEQIVQERMKVFPVGYLVTDLAGRILRADPEAHTLLGELSGRLAGKLISFYIKKDEIRSLPQHLTQIFQEKKPQTWRMHFLQRGKEPVLHNVTVSPGGNVDGAPASLHWLIQPTT